MGSYRVVFLGSFFLSILSFIGATLIFLRYSLAGNLSLLGLFVAIMYLRGIIVLFSYSFILSDVKVRFHAHPLNTVGFIALLISLCVQGGLESFDTDVSEVYSHRFSTLAVGRLLLYAVLRACLSLCLGSHVR